MILWKFDLSFGDAVSGALVRKGEAWLLVVV